MKLLPKDKDKRNKLLLTIAAIGALLCLFVLFVIRPQYKSLADTGKDITQERDKLQKIEDAIKRSGTTATDLDALTATLKQSEQDMAAGDIYAWTYDFIRRFKRGYDVDIPTVGQPVVTDVDLLPQFPYKQVKISLTGSAYYHDFGKFVSDLENIYPHMRVINISLEAPQNVADGQKLTFRAEVIALIKPNS